MIHPSPGERNYLKAASAHKRQDFFIGNKTAGDFRLLSDSGTFDLRDAVSDEENHFEMLDAMVSNTSDMKATYNKDKNTTPFLTYFVLFPCRLPLDSHQRPFNA